MKVMLVEGYSEQLLEEVFYYLQERENEDRRSL